MIARSRLLCRSCSKAHRLVERQDPISSPTQTMNSKFRLALALLLGVGLVATVSLLTLMASKSQGLPVTVDGGGQVAELRWLGSQVVSESVAATGEAGLGARAGDIVIEFDGEPELVQRQPSAILYADQYPEIRLSTQAVKDDVRKLRLLVPRGWPRSTRQIKIEIGNGHWTLTKLPDLPPLGTGIPEVDSNLVIDRTSPDASSGTLATRDGSVPRADFLTLEGATVQVAPGLAAALGFADQRTITSAWLPTAKYVEAEVPGPAKRVFSKKFSVELQLFPALRTPQEAVGPRQGPYPVWCGVKCKPIPTPDGPIQIYRVEQVGQDWVLSGSRNRAGFETSVRMIRPGSGDQWLRWIRQAEKTPNRTISIGSHEFLYEELRRSGVRRRVRIPLRLVRANT